MAAPHHPIPATRCALIRPAHDGGRRTPRHRTDAASQKIRRWQPKPKAVQTGSINWSDTGICAQSNNTIIIESEQLASFYFDYWNRLKAQGNAQDKTFRADNAAPRSATVDGKEVTLWFSPNTQASTKTRTSATNPIWSWCLT
jgi:hypothetical protein